MITHDDQKLLLALLQDPARFTGLSIHQVDRLLRYARRANLLASLGQRLRAGGQLGGVAGQLVDCFEAADMIAGEHERRLRWEVDQLRPWLQALDVPVVVLKGGAYLLSGLPSAQGRLVSDLDLLVPEAELERVEQAMLASGYVSQKQDEYDQHYYREWAHELPPMAHVARGTTVDLHHNITPRTSRLNIDAGLLLQAAVPLQGYEPLLRFCDEDLVLHVCVHMFHDGELENSLRELLDLDSLLRRAAVDEDFWQRLLARAQQLGVMRPLYYGVHFAQRFLDSPVPDPVQRFLQIAAPAQPGRMIVERCMQSAILPAVSDRPTLWRGIAARVLFLRSHWLRMPPLLLLRHLLTQAWRRGGIKTAEKSA